MPRLSLRARFPLGVFQGRQQDGTPAPLPDTARLHAALVHAASKGSSAVVRNGDLRASTVSIAALEWLETHQPDSLMLPEWVPTQSRRPIAFREEGWLEKGRLKKAANSISIGHSLADDVGWLWNDAPKDVCETVAALCADVACLGETESVVVLEAAAIEPTHHCNPSLGQLDPQGLPVRSPAPGRWISLERAYEQAHPKKRPSVASDRASQSESSRSAPVPDDDLRIVKYESTSPVLPDAPWPTAVLLAADATVSSHERVVWSVALHRMLAARLGDEAPAVVTGRYGRGVSQPANRVAVQYLPSSALQHRPELADSPNGAFALMLPHCITPVERAQIHHALRGRLRIYRRSGEIRLTVLGEIDAATFWPAPVDGWTRTWLPLPALVPDVRRQPATNAGPWTLRDTALLSMAFVFRDRLPSSASRRDYRGLVELVRSHGARVHHAALIPDAQIVRYAHKVPPSMGVVQPYRAMIEIGDLVDPRGLLAVGQSRHLGGGFLMPQDAPVDDLEEMWA